MLNSSSAQLILTNYSIDKSIYIESLNHVFRSITNDPDIAFAYSEDFLLFTNHVDEFIRFCIPQLVMIKNEILLKNGLSVYNLTFGAILSSIINKKLLIEKIALYKYNNNTSNLFYQSPQTFSTSIFSRDI